MTEVLRTPEERFMDLPDFPYDPIYIEAERHAVWLLNGNYKDISFNADGEERILFLPDVPEKQGELDLNVGKIRWGKDEKTRNLIKIQEMAESFISEKKMSDEEAWNTMLTFKEWTEGQRMPSLIKELG